MPSVSGSRDPPWRKLLDYCITHLRRYLLTALWYALHRCRLALASLIDNPGSDLGGS